MKNPYSSLPGSPRQTVQGRVSMSDFTYLRRLFPMKVGIQDAIISTLYHKFINELRARNITPDNIDNVAWELDHPTHAAVDSVLSSLHFSGNSRPAPIQTSPRDDGHGTSGLHQEVCSVEKLLADAERLSASRRASEAGSD